MDFPAVSSAPPPSAPEPAAEETSTPEASAPETSAPAAAEPAAPADTFSPAANDNAAPATAPSSSAPAAEDRPSSAPRTTPAAGRGVPFSTDSFTPASERRGAQQPAAQQNQPTGPAASANQPAPAAPANQNRPGGGLAGLFGGGNRTPPPPPTGRSPEGDAFRTATSDFRTQLSEARDLRSQLDKLPADDPKRKELETKLADVDGKLKKSSGYTSETAPKPGTQWIDPRMQRGLTPNAKDLPVGKPVTEPAKPNDVLFGGGKSVTLTGPDGKERTFKNAEEYSKYVAEQRAAAGMPKKDGDPIGVHLTMMGGGGQGKRYMAALNEMLGQGIVPTSVSGTSAGSIGAALIAAGGDPKKVSEFMLDPNLQRNMNDANAYNTLDQRLRELTGIKDRPVTFADLKMPLQVVATKYSDTQPEPGKADLTDPANRRFVFSQETTPNTPVALAVRASMAIPMIYDPVRMTDPTTGREMHLFDGGILDNLPTDTAPKGQPMVGLSLWDKGTLAPTGDNVARPQPLQAGNIDTGRGQGLSNLQDARTMRARAAGIAGDYRDVTQPRPGQFQLALPTWDLNDPRNRNEVLKFDWDKKVDPELDKQTRAVTRDFFKKYMGDLGDPAKSGTNTRTVAPKDLSFDRKVTFNGQDYNAKYDGKGSVVFTRNGEQYTARLTRTDAERLHLDHQSFGDMNGQLGNLLRQEMEKLERVKKAG